MMPGIEDNPDWAPFIGYIRNQVNRWQIVNDESEVGGICRKFQTGLVDKTFCIDTTGEYSQCNLIDSSTTVKNPKGIRPKECEDCEYSHQAECFTCGSEFKKSCEAGKEFCRMLEEFEQIRSLLDEVLKNKPCDCEQKNCTCKGNGNSIYCVKEYNL